MSVVPKAEGGVRVRRHGALVNLADPGLLRELAYIDGRWTAGPKDFPVTDPDCGLPLGHVAAIDASGTASAIEAASSALAGWQSLLPQERGAILQRWHALMIGNREDLALLMVLEQGKPIVEARAEIDYAASFLEWFAQEGCRLNTEGITSHLPDAEMIVRREPLGVAALVTPWNFPSAMLTRKAAAALAAGCTVVAHPSSETPLSALALAELGERAGLPAGVFNIVTGDAEEIVGVLCDDPRVRALSFTGSSPVGARIAARCAPSMKRLVMELGGHAPLIVFEDANLGRAVDIAMDAKFATSGQDCLAANRIFVHRSLKDAFLTLFAERIAGLRVGSGLEAGTEIGPLIHERAVAKVDEQVRDAIARGARCLTGGGRHAAGPLYYTPTLLADVPDDALIMREETFGPVAAVTSFDTEEEVIRRANATDYGLVAYVVTADGARQWRMGRALDFGMIAINRVKMTGSPVPFGGWKHSGTGREGSRHGLEAFTELKYLCIDTAARAAE
ncbi:NAD-dependent succinate-semialdehyde dehydrogenase [Rhizobiaceae bacterium BDR2-2]|uniref:NAD-dependent succinate-semialdehyde dehydrogenase n=1 Tax=Ectorhizobium quercum TaxID=2965071 RepID=A0AAE3ST92_9HYPH|nr:NAD-dependent succinate-semialdehyde dehydrogenase [Ectorhizobium quercum]MCX8995900.1 NAD-dependent succinate-semialdehyde dehydrogenase [Ectorhizobium quercum]